jgi:hypothetical protein
MSFDPSRPVRMLPLTLLGGIELTGIDGLILLFTAVVVIAVVLFSSLRLDEPAPVLSDDDLLRELARGTSLADSPAMSYAAQSVPATAMTQQGVEGAPRPATKRQTTKRTATTSAPVAAVGLLGGLALITFGQNLLLRSEPSAAAFVLWVAGLLLIVALYRRIDRAPHYAAAAAAGTKRAYLAATGEAALLFIAIASFYIWRRGHDRAATDTSVDLIILWIASIAALIVACAGMPRREHLARLRSWTARNRSDILITAGIALIALIPRLYSLSSYPWAMSGDEGTFGVTARGVLRGELSNPFTSGPWGYPSLLFIVQGWLIDLWGSSVGGARLLSALLGTGSVVASYWLARHQLGRWVGLVTAAIAIVFHFDLFWSRNAQNAVAPMFFIPLALLFLDRALVARGRVDSLAAGLIIGFAQFFHPANRILFPMAAAYVAYALVRELALTRRSVMRVARDVAPYAFWVAGAAVVAHLPLLRYFSTHRDQFSSRTNEVSVFASGWLDREQEITGLGPLHILWTQFQNAALLPFNTIPHGHFRPEPPFAGWPLVIPLAIGMAIATLAFWERRYFGLAMGFWATVVGIALTSGPPESNRYTSSGPFLVIFAALGIVAVAQIAIKLIRVPRIAVASLAAATVLLIVVWNLNFVFREPNDVAVTSDVNTQIANRLARDAEAHGDGLTVFLSGVPRLYYGGFQNIDYIADGAVGIDVDEPWDTSDSPPELTGPTLFAFVPERFDELEVVRGWFPDGRVSIYALPNGEENLTTYFVDAPVTESVAASRTP